MITTLRFLPPNKVKTYSGSGGSRLEKCLESRGIAGDVWAVI